MRGVGPGLTIAFLNAIAPATAPGNEAPDPHPQSNTNPQPMRVFQLNAMDAFFETVFEFDQTRVQSRSRPGQPRGGQENRDWQVRETIGFSLNGHLIDPEILSFSGSLTFGLSQSGFREHRDATTTVDRDSGGILRYDLRANLFQGNPLSGSVYALRDDDRITRRFQPTLRQERNAFGATWNLAHEHFPMTLTYDYRETDRTGNRDPINDEHFIESSLTYNVDWLIDEGHKATLTYEHAESQQDFQGAPESFNTTRDQIRLDHVLSFGPADQHELRTIFRWQEESGDVARDLLQIGPQLTLNHGDTLETRYQYQFNREQFQSLDIATHRLDWSLIHELYTNLTTTVNFFGLYEEIDLDADTVQYGANVDWQYRKNNTIGAFSANLRLAYDTQDVRGSDAVRYVFDEAVTFRDPVAPTLRNRDILTDSVIVTDATNRRILRRGLDYHLRQIGDAVLISRIRTGMIADNDTVLVDYAYQTPENGKIDTIRVDCNIEQRFNNGLTPYYRLSYRNQEDDPSTGFQRLADRTNHHRVGLEFDASRFHLAAEYEIFDDAVEPYDAFHLRARASLLQTAQHQLDAAARLSRLYFRGGVDRRNVTLVDLELDHRWQLADRISTVERLAYRFEDDSRDGDTHAWDLSAGLQYVWGDLSGEITFDYDHLGLPDSDQDDFGLYVRVRRSFRNVLSR